jgi:hypothetical protein
MLGIAATDLFEVTFPKTPRIGGDIERGKISFDERETDAPQVLSVPLVEDAGKIPLEKSLGLKLLIRERIIPHQLGIDWDVVESFDHLYSV